MKTQTLNTVSPGGVISTGSLRQLALHCQTADVHLRIGRRMNLTMDLKPQIVPEFTRRLREWVEFSSSENNVISSACSMESHAWLKESTMIEAAESVASVSSPVEVSLIDPGQTLVPRFESELNFLAMPEEGTWSCVVRREGVVHSTAARILTQDLPEAVSTYSAASSGKLSDRLRVFGGPAPGMEPPLSARPEYEGFHKHGGKWSLGFFHTSGRYDGSLVEEMAYLCTKDSLGRVYLTPWHSFLIKGIPERSLLVWEDYLRRRGIETRHASSALYWRMLGGEPLLYEARDRIVRECISREVPSHVVFAAGRDTAEEQAAISIELTGRFPARFRLYSKQYALDRKKHGTFLLGFLPRAVRKLLENASGPAVSSPQQTPSALQSAPAVKSTHASYVCEECMNVYSAEYGDAVSGVLPGVPFESVPPTYACPVCGADKKRFKKAA